MNQIPLCRNSDRKVGLIVSAAAIVFVAVALGAFGAHALKPALVASGHLDSWETAVLYQLVHGVASLALGIWRHLEPSASRSRVLGAVGWLWTFGTCFFSGSLYLLSFNGPRWLGPITPIGGLCLLAGWLVLAIAALRLRRDEAGEA